MKIGRKTVFLTVFVILMITLPSFADAADPGLRWYVTGYVKKSGTSTAISGAMVKIYNDGAYRGTVYTSSTGYFSFSTSIQPTNNEFGWQVTISKTGYLTTTRYAYAQTYVTNMGTIYMSVPPPPPPPESAEIENVIVGNGIISWDVDWDDTSTGYSTKAWWSTDSSMGSEDLIFSTTTKQASYSAPLPINADYLKDGTFYYQVYAMNSKNGYYPETYIGPEGIVHDGIWRIAPTDDAYTNEQYPDSTYNNDKIHVSNEYSEESPYFNNGWLKFNVLHPEAVKSMWLNLYIYSTGYAGHGEIKIREVGSSEWSESDITWNAESEVYSGIDFGIDSSGISGQWDIWDISAINHTDGVAVSLNCRKTGPYDFGNGVYYCSSEYSDSTKRPYLVVEYYSEPEEYHGTGIPILGDTFSGPSLDTQWIMSSTDTVPTWDYDLGWDSSDLEDAGCLRWANGDRLTHTDARGYDLWQTDFSLDSDFIIRTRLGWTLETGGVGSPAIEFGIALLGEYDNTLAYIKLNHGGWWAEASSRLKAKIGANSEVEDPIGIPPLEHTGYFEFRRYSYTNYNKLQLLWKSDITDAPVPITENYEPGKVCGMRIWIRAWTDGYHPSRTFEVFLDSVKQVPVEALASPLENIGAFQEPINNPAFDDLDGSYIDAWMNEDNITHATGYQVQTPTIESSNSWHAISATQRWVMIQQLNDREKFSLMSLNGRNVAFSYSARAVDCPIRVRAMILYRTAEREFSVQGDWVELPQDNRWYQVTVRTLFPLPDDLLGAQVRMIGWSETMGESFEAFVDEPRLSIVTDCVYPMKWSYTNHRTPDERGLFSLSLHTHNAALINGKYHIDFGVVINSESLYGLGSEYEIKYLNILSDVESSNPSHSTNFAEIYPRGGDAFDILSEDNDVFDVFDNCPAIEHWNLLCSMMNTPIMRYGTSLVTGGILSAAGVPYPVTTTVVSLVNNAVSWYCQPRLWGVTDNYATFGDPGLVEIPYSLSQTPFPDNEVSFITRTRASYDLHWTVSPDSGNIIPPAIQLTVVLGIGPQDMTDNIDVILTHSATIWFPFP